MLGTWPRPLAALLSPPRQFMACSRRRGRRIRTPDKGTVQGFHLPLDPATHETPEWALCLGGNRLVLAHADSPEEPQAGWAGLAAWRLGGPRRPGQAPTLAVRALGRLLAALALRGPEGGALACGGTALGGRIRKPDKGIAQGFQQGFQARLDLGAPETPGGLASGAALLAFMGSHRRLKSSVKYAPVFCETFADDGGALSAWGPERQPGGCRSGGLATPLGPRKAEGLVASSL